ncbi:hypothetical protein VTK26DRAFT_365 [Humicola hyalothermophila]
MNEPPSLSPAHYAQRGRQLQPISDSSTRQRNTDDDLLSNLTPRTAVDAFRTPTDTLKACIDAATPAERAFALRVAVASNSIFEWLEELSSWPWPHGGSAGFEMPPARRMGLSSSQGDGNPDEEYIGSLPASDVARYERRIDEIAQALEDLDIEEIKRQVLNNHIMPLSRPGTPVPGSGRTTLLSLSNVSIMDDLAALVTATTVQALPNLSKLTRLMGAWNFRLLVLRKIPVFLASVADAEVALQAGWKAIRVSHAGHGPHGASATGSTALSRAEFDIMKPILERKVAKAGRDLDAMLDLLEGQPDTLPEDWIDRVDALEHGYGEWTVACEREIREADWARLMRESGDRQRARQETDVNAVAAESGSNPNAPLDTEPQAEHGQLLGRPLIKIHPSTEDLAHHPGLDGSNRTPSARQTPEPVAQNGAMEPGSAHKGETESDSALSDASEDDAPAAKSQLAPPLRRGSGASGSATVIHEPPATFTDSFSSDQLDYGTPQRQRHRDVDSEGSGDDSAPDSPSFRAGARSMSVSFDDKLTVTEIPSFRSPPSTPTKSDVEDDVSRAPDSPLEPSVPSSDDQLRQQISEILESVPAKIRLTSEPPAINLNPPDFKMPTARKTSKSGVISRSQSNVSLRSNYSRSATPSFTLAPANGRTSRPRHHRGNQDIKLYHLSRSNGEAPIKLFIRCVGENGERVMVRVGGGWADLGEYLKEYATHHLRRAGGAAALATDPTKIEVKDVPQRPAVGTPPSRPSSAHDNSPQQNQAISPLRLRKTRRPPSRSEDSPAPASASASASVPRPKTPLARISNAQVTPPSDTLTTATAETTGSASSSSSSSSSLQRSGEGPSRSRRSSSSRALGGRARRLSWGMRYDEDGVGAVMEHPELGMAGPRAKRVEMSEESRRWVECVKEKVRIASGERKVSPLPLPAGGAMAAVGTAGSQGHGQEGKESRDGEDDGGGDGNGNGGLLEGVKFFGELGTVGGTKRLFRRQG